MARTQRSDGRSSFREFVATPFGLFTTLMLIAATIAALLPVLIQIIRLIGVLL